MHHAGTHNGRFHCDEVLACYMLKLLPEYRDAEIVRTRDPKVGRSCPCHCIACCMLLSCSVLCSVCPWYASPSCQLLETCDVVVDVGGIYDPSVHRYDHHQRCVWVCACVENHVYTHMIICLYISPIHASRYARTHTHTHTHPRPPTHPHTHRGTHTHCVPSLSAPGPLMAPCIPSLTDARNGRPN